MAECGQIIGLALRKKERIYQKTKQKEEDERKIPRAVNWKKEH